MTDNFIGQFSGDYCIYFYVLTIISLVCLLVTLVNGIFLVHKKKADVMHTVGVVIATGVVYFQNRLLYSMCVGALQNGS